MVALWGDSAWMTPREMQPHLPHDLAQTTVGTVMVRLWRKGLLERRRRGRAYEYHAIDSREVFAARRMSEILGATGDRTVALHRFIELLPQRDRGDLRQALEGDDE